MSDCALCRLAEMPIDERETKTFFSTFVHIADPRVPAGGAGLMQVEVVRDADLDGASDRLLCYTTAHMPEFDGVRLIEARWQDCGFVRLREMMSLVIAAIADCEFGEGQWDFEATMRSCAEHGWHCHARKKE